MEVAGSYAGSEHSPHTSCDHLYGSRGAFAIWSIIPCGFFNSISFPVFSPSASPKRGATGDGSAAVMAIVGGAIIPLLFGALADMPALAASRLHPPAVCYPTLLLRPKRLQSPGSGSMSRGTGGHDRVAAAYCPSISKGYADFLGLHKKKRDRTEVLSLYRKWFRSYVASKLPVQVVPHPRCPSGDVVFGDGPQPCLVSQ